MTAREKDQELCRRIWAQGVFIRFSDANTLRRAELTLTRWAELECGTEAGCIERDEETGIPRFYNARTRYLSANDPRRWRRIPDREKGALARVAAVCKALGLHYYHQTDPRGPALYISREPLTDSNYTRGAHCSV